MKTITLKGSFLMAIFSLIVMMSYSQRHYKHLKRVKIDASKIEKPAATNIEPGKAAKNIVITNQLIQQDVAQENVAAQTSAEVASVASTDVAKAKKDSQIRKDAKVKKEKNAKLKIGSFTEKLQQQHKVWDVVKVKKANLETWVLIMIILYAAGFLFLILALIFIFALGSGIALVFWLLMVLCWLAASIVLILGLTGVM